MKLVIIINPNQVSCWEIDTVLRTNFFKFSPTKIPLLTTSIASQYAHNVVNSPIVRIGRSGPGADFAKKTAKIDSRITDRAMGAQMRPRTL